MEFKFKKFLFNGELISETEFKDYYEYHKKNVYEVIRIINSKILFLNDHISRLSNSILLMYGNKINLDDLIPNIEKVIQLNLYLRMIRLIYTFILLVFIILIHGLG